MRESQIEKAVAYHARGQGWLCYKWTSPGTRGVPDRIFIKDGQFKLVEFKAPGGRLSEHQRRAIAILEAAGAEVHVIDNVEAGRALFDA